MLLGSYRKLPNLFEISHGGKEYLLIDDSEEEDPDEYPFPLTLRKRGTGPTSPATGTLTNGN